MPKLSRKLLITVCGLITVACSSGGQVAQTNSNPLGYYFSLLRYEPLGPSSQAAPFSATTSANGQFSFSTTESYQLTTLNINFYSDTQCSALQQSASIPGYQTLQPGTYSVTDQSNFYVCDNLIDGGCQELFEELGNNVKSLQFQFVFNNNSVYKSGCLYNPQLGYEGFANYQTNPVQACTSSESCSLSQSYPVSDLPQVVNQSWQKISANSGLAPISLASVDAGGQIYAVQQSNDAQSVFDCGYTRYCNYILTPTSNDNTSFINYVAHVGDPVRTFVAGDANYIYWGSAAFIGGNFDGYQLGGSDPFFSYQLDAYYPTGSYYKAFGTNQGIYWGDNNGNLYLNDSQINSFNPPDFNTWNGVKSITFDTQGNLWWGAVGQLGQARVVVCPNYGLGTCSLPSALYPLPLSVSSTYSGINVSADLSGNVYVGYGLGGLLYQYQSTQQATLLYQPIPGALSNSNFVGTNTNVVFDAYHNQLWYSTALNQSFLNGSQILGFDSNGSLAQWQLPPIPGETSAPSQLLVFPGPASNQAIGTIYAVYPDAVYYIQYQN